MATKKSTYTPSMSDDAVEAKTGKTWKAWFAALDKAGAKKLDHKAIAHLLSKEHGVPGWWAQNITVEYERSRGLRVRHQTTSGFSVGVNKTIATTLSALYAATATEARRAKWFPAGAFAASSQTKNKYLNGSWKGSARLNVGFYAKKGSGDGKAQIAIQVGKLKAEADVERERKAWKAAVERLQEQLEA
ncbi:hypothetical protein HNQ60_002805 [Povalibacter uvarum]|uniref:DUF4287 domain-containing protein n=1 Tax=Povalibacter uvarum TaxID=732238 RepID=A0A841HMU0_9GAMM|nr:DUF4287 domain-containing protein [Povalibacter uvarum]MBB6093924.1 hypothetical protein [Povalibacter uvarum]